jgi:hypothetical protein
MSAPRGDRSGIGQPAASKLDAGQRFTSGSQKERATREAPGFNEKGSRLPRAWQWPGNPVLDWHGDRVTELLADQFGYVVFHEAHSFDNAARVQNRRAVE